MSKLVIKEADVSVLPQLHRLFVKAVQTHFTYFPEDVRQRVIREHSLPRLLKGIFDPKRVILTAQMEGKVVGYAIGSVPSSGPAQMYWLYVDPACRGQNTGLKLLSRMLKIQERKGAQEVYISTYDHRHYYERQGFIYISREHLDGIQMDILAYKVGKTA